MVKNNILGMPKKAFYIVCLFLVIGILIGSIYDYRISESLSNINAIGNLVEQYGNILSHCLYPVAGICIFKGLRKKSLKYNNLAWGTLILSLFWTFYSFIDTGGKFLRGKLGYIPGESSIFPLLLAALIWITITIMVAIISYKIIDDTNANQLIAIGAIILIGGIFAEFINGWLKSLGSRPRYKYLITLDNPHQEFKNWWEMVPYFSGNTLFRSWPSGHITRATIMLTLPLIVPVIRNSHNWWKYVSFGFAIIWIIIIGYNRIHMNAHFLSDVCFGALITYCLYAAIYVFVSSALSSEIEK